DPAPPPGPWPPPRTLIFTTEGSTEDATSWTDPSGSSGATEAVLVLCRAGLDVLVAAGSSLRASYVAAPPSPPSPPKRRAPASSPIPVRRPPRPLPDAGAGDAAGAAKAKPSGNAVVRSCSAAVSG